MIIHDTDILVCGCEREAGGTKTIGIPQFDLGVVNPLDIILRENDGVLIQENDGSVIGVDNI